MGNGSSGRGAARRAEARPTGTAHGHALAPRVRPSDGGRLSRRGAARRAEARPTSRANRDWLATRYPDASLLTFIKRDASRAHEAKWLGSYRYATVNLGGASREDLELRFADVCRHVRFDGSRRAQGMVMPTVKSAALPPSRTNSPQ